VQLKDVADINPRLRVKPAFDAVVSFVPMSAVDQGTGTMMPEERLYGDISSGLTPFINGDVLVAKITPCFENGKIAQATIPRSLGIGSTEFHVLRSRPDRIAPRYLFHYLRQDRVRLEGERRMTGSAGQRRVPAAFLSDLSIPLPPLPEQRRIAHILDQADALRVKRRAALEHIDRLRRSIFDEMFGRGPISPVTVSRQALDHREGWPWETLTDVARLATGHTPDREVPSYWDGDIPWISLTEIRGLDGTVADSIELHVSQDGIDHSSSVLLPAGTVCFSRTASIGFVTVMGRPMATSQDFVNWVCGDSLRPLYLMHALLRSREQLRDLSTGSTHKTIYMRVAEQFRVLVPPVALQDEFVSRIGALTSFKLGLMNSATTTDCLFASLQYRAFRGEL
jgi:type I restriction enzyme S subunit